MDTFLTASLAQNGAGSQVENVGQIAEDVSRLEAETGQTVQVLPTDWMGRMREGVLAQVHIRRWRGSTKLTHEDLGIDSGHRKALSKVVKLGEKLLVPERYVKGLSAVEARIRDRITRYSFDTPWGHFIPVTAYAAFKADFAERVEQYYAVRDELDRTYSDWTAEMRGQYAALAQASYRRLAAVAPKLVEGTGEDVFVSRYLQAVMSRIPSRQEIYDSFAVDLELSYIPLPSLLAQDMAQARSVQVQVGLAEERAQAQRALEREREETERQVLRQQVRAARSEADRRVAMIEEMNRDVVAKAQAQKEEMVDAFLTGIQAQLTGLIYNACRDVLGKLQGAETLPARSIVQLKSMVEQVSLLNFTDDRDAARMIQRVQDRIIQVEAPDRDYADIQRQLRAIVTVTRSALMDLGEEPGSVRGLDLEDRPAAASVDFARRELDLDASTAAAETPALSRDLDLGD